jgi:cobalt-precorrin-5B (C1)-methyltransferase
MGELHVNIILEKIRSAQKVEVQTHMPRVAYRETITLSLDVARGSEIPTIGFSTGGKSEKYLRKLRPDLPETAFVQAGDFFSFSLKNAAKRRFGEILYAAFFGKMVKMAQGHGQTHAARSAIDFDVLSSWCASFGMKTGALRSVRQSNTAREALAIIRAEDPGIRILQHITGRALLTARRFAGFYPDLCFYLFDFEGDLLSAAKSQGKADKGRRTE